MTNTFLTSYINILGELALFLTGIFYIYTHYKFKKIYCKYFDNKSEISIDDLAKELQIEKRKLIFELSFLIYSKKEHKNLKTCEKVKFEE